VCILSTFGISLKPQNDQIILTLPPLETEEEDIDFRDIVSM
jgi:hypothetical protein